MPRVSPEHMHARKEEILSAGERCFARDGFHATSMQDIFAESGLSAGAVYRYFPSKAALVRAIVGRVLDGVLSDFADAAAQDPPRPLAEVLTETFGQRVTAESVRRIRPIILQVWAEMARDEGIRAMGQETMGEIRDVLARLVRRAQQTGQLPGHGDHGHRGLLATRIEARPAPVRQGAGGRSSCGGPATSPGGWNERCCVGGAAYHRPHDHNLAAAQGSACPSGG